MNKRPTRETTIYQKEKEKENLKKTATCCHFAHLKRIQKETHIYEKETCIYRKETHERDHDIRKRKKRP